MPAVNDIVRLVDTTSVQVSIKTGCFYHHAQTSPNPFRRKGKICATEYQMPKRTHALSNIVMGFEKVGRYMDTNSMTCPQVQVRALRGCSGKAAGR
jgi:hypothetical protein